MKTYLLYYIDNDGDTLSYLEYIRLVLQMCNRHHLSVYGQYIGNIVIILLKYQRNMINNRVMWTYIGYIQSVLQMYYGHQLGLYDHNAFKM